MAQPDLNSMTDDQVAEWFAGNDTSGLVGTGSPVEGQFVQVDEAGVPVGRMVSLRCRPPWSKPSTPPAATERAAPASSEPP